MSKHNQVNSITFKDLRMTLRGSWPTALPSKSSFCLKGTHLCSCVLLSACLLPVEFWGSTSLLSFHPLSVPFNPSWQFFCWSNILKILWAIAQPSTDNMDRIVNKREINVISGGRTGLFMVQSTTYVEHNHSKFLNMGLRLVRSSNLKLYIRTWYCLKDLSTVLLYLLQENVKMSAKKYSPCCPEIADDY